jgi:uncharacterized RDD family membrane protein YckC
MQLAEIDGYDPSEEQFASSLAGRDAAEERQEISSGSLTSARQRRHERELPDIEIPLPMSNSQPAPPPPDDESWRNEVSSRIQNYKARRRRSLGDDESLSFNFESTAGNHVFLRPEREPEPESVVATEPEPDPIATYYAHPYATAPSIEPEYEPVAEPEFAEPDMPMFAAAPVAQETAKLILFPKPPMMQEAPADQLAEPVFDVPRIVEAPEATEQVMVPLADITLQPDHREDACVPYIEPVLELPRPVASTAHRFCAEFADLLIVMVGTFLFGIIAARLGATPVLADMKLLIGTTVVVAAIFWSTYKYVFLVHGAITPGMRLAHVKLVNFEGAAPSTVRRRVRALAMLLATFPLGLGILWSFVDPYRLCWHDRISKTYVTLR